MAFLSELATLRARVAASPGRLEKCRLVADYLRGLSPEDLRLAVTYLSGRAFAVSDPRVLNVRGAARPCAGCGLGSRPIPTLSPQGRGGSRGGGI